MEPYFQVSYFVCAGKGLSEIPTDMENEGVAEVVHQYLQECQLMSSLQLTIDLG